MLVLARKKGESIIIDDLIEVVVLEAEGDTVKLGIQAPKTVSVYRKEIYRLIQQENQSAIQSNIQSLDISAWVNKSKDEPN